MEVIELDAFADGNWILVFDGRVLQIFGAFDVHTATHAPLVDSWSIHVRQLTVRIEQLKEGKRVTFCSLASARGCPERGILALTFTDPVDARWDHMQTFVGALKGAGAKIA